MDEEIAGIIAASLTEGGVLDDYHPDDRDYLTYEALKVLAALRAEGFDIYRPGDCVPVAPMKAAYNLAYGKCHPSKATHRLVPAERGE